ncbi:MAG: Lrp/AsnC family transcriptional regulator [Nanoarchaeota archaeon]
MAKIDYLLLYLISENARIGLKELSRQLKKSSQRIKYSLAVMEKEGLISNPYCVFDYSYFGLILFRVYFKGGYISEKDKEKIVAELKDNPFVVSIYELTGEFDLAVEFASPNPSKFNKELKKVAALAPTLNDYKIVLNVVTRLYSREYLPGCSEIEQIFSERIVGGDREREEFDMKQMEVIKAILLNPRIRYKELAKDTNQNIKTVRKTLNELQKRNIVKGFKYIVDTDKLGITKNRLFLKLHNVSTEREIELLQFMSRTKEIIQVNKTVGDWDMEIDIEALSANEIRAIITRLREEFKDLIERFNLIEFFTTFKRFYLPLYIFKDVAGESRRSVVEKERGFLDDLDGGSPNKEKLKRNINLQEFYDVSEVGAG